MNQVQRNKAVKQFNTFTNFVNTKIAFVLAREGELSSSYFVDGLEARLDALQTRLDVLSESGLTVQDVIDNIVEINAVYALLKDGYAGLKASGRY